MFQDNMCLLHLYYLQFVCDAIRCKCINCICIYILFNYCNIFLIAFSTIHFITCWIEEIYWKHSLKKKLYITLLMLFVFTFRTPSITTISCSNARQMVSYLTVLDLTVPWFLTSVHLWVTIKQTHGCRD